VKPTLAPNYSFLTQSSLAVDATTAPDTASFTDPDQATTTFEPESASPSSVPTLAPLPAGMPARIYSQDQIPPTQDLTGLTLISILFNSALNWPFVVGNPVASSQIFAYFPTVIQTALELPTEQVLTFALQVFVPDTYHSTADAAKLGTIWLGYIPTGQLDALASQIKAQSSPFYKGTTGIPAELAAKVNPSFPINSVPDPNVSPTSSGNSSGSSSSSSSDGKIRQNAIIGVVSAFGAIALLVLAFLVFRSYKRRQELAHHRLSDPSQVHGLRPEGREFDQDSLGGQRRRSFYFAEDSLRGFQGDRPEEANYDSRVNPTTGMSQRRVVPATISAPILRESSMNW